MSIPLLITLAIVIPLVLWGVATYNRLVGARNGFGNAFAQIDVQLTRRYDLIPNLVDTARAYMQHERDTLEAVMKARNAAVAGLRGAVESPGSATAMQTLAGAEATLGGALGRLFALSEAYPDLKANASMMQLSEELTSTENRIAFARQAFNDSVLTYNNLREMFPWNLIAALFSFAAAKPFETTSAEARQAPRVGSLLGRPS